MGLQIKKAEVDIYIEKIDHRIEGIAKVGKGGLFMNVPVKY